MKSEWRVTSQYIDDLPHFAVYRLRNVGEIDHSGNREYYGGYTPDEEQAERLARKLNAEEKAEKLAKKLNAAEKVNNGKEVLI